MTARGGRNGRVEILRDPHLGEEVHRRVFPSGLTVCVARKRDFTKSYATLATRYGSIDTRLPRGGRRLPDGIAHFLEHKVFETAEGDAFELFAARGGSPNAFTSYASTRYLFGTSTDYGGNLRTLLDMVFELETSVAGVEREKGIIGQEIAMFRDEPGWGLYHGLVRALFPRHPVRISVLGTERTIAKIDVALLRDVHRAYYHPRNMVLSAVSPEPVRATFAAVEECVEGRRFGPAPGPRRIAPEAGDAPVRRNVRLRLAVARPRLLLGARDDAPPRGGRARLRRQLASAIALDCLFGNAGSIFVDLYERGLVDESFSCSYTAEAGYAFLMIGGETDEPTRLRRTLDRALARALDEGIPAETFERVRNKMLGGYARAFNAPERIAHMLVRHHLRGTVLADYREQLLRVHRAEVTRRLREMFRPERRSYGTARPR